MIVKILPCLCFYGVQWTPTRNTCVCTKVFGKFNNISKFSQIQPLITLIYSFYWQYKRIGSSINCFIVRINKTNTPNLNAMNKWIVRKKYMWSASSYLQILGRKSIFLSLKFVLEELAMLVIPEHVFSIPVDTVRGRIPNSARTVCAGLIYADSLVERALCEEQRHSDKQYLGCCKTLARAISGTCTLLYTRQSFDPSCRCHLYDDCNR